MVLENPGKVRVPGDFAGQSYNQSALCLRNSRGKPVPWARSRSISAISGRGSNLAVGRIYL